MSPNECPICSTRPERESRAIIENDSWRATLGANQGYVGTLFIELLEHQERLADLSNAQWLGFAAIVRQAERIEAEAFGAAMFNWSCFMNNLYKATPPTPHVHWHVRPRYNREVVVAGQRFVDPNFGHHYDKEHLAHVSPAVKDGIADALRAAAKDG